MSGLRASAQADSPFCSLKFVGCIQALGWNTRPSVHCLHTCPSGLFTHLISPGRSSFSLPFPFCLTVCPFRIHPYCMYLVRLFRSHPPLTCAAGFSARTFCTHLLRTLPHANFHNARLIGLSLRLSNKLFRVNFHNTSRESLHSKPERANAAQTMSRFC